MRLMLVTIIFISIGCVFEAGFVVYKMYVG